MPELPSYGLAQADAQPLMPGTDHSFDFHQPRPLARLAEAGFDAATQDALAFGNARRVLGRALEST